MKLEPPLQQYVLHCGEMGSKWGINRSVAQIHALLFVSGRPLTAEEIVETLGIARSNVGTGLKELQGWGLLHTTQKLGDRRDFFESFSDPWESFRAIIRTRKTRELEPSLRTLRECAQQARAKSSKVPDDVADRLVAMQEFVELMDNWGERASKLSAKNLRRLSQLGDFVFRLVE